MAANGFSHQVEAYSEWKRGLIDEIGHYRDWLTDNGLASEDIQQRLTRGCKLLQEDQLTIAFVGEYSRGKTELINALIFAEFGQRMLPSQAGRTTMCPTEIFYDDLRDACYLRLLPIETRLQNLSIADLKKDAAAWHEITIDPNDPDQMSFSLQQVAKSRTASLDEAKALGFDVNLLERVKGHANEVFIPAWRHALISLDSPLLRQGLRVLDTPGLNALGAEPELTISMIPNAQAVVFLLSADAGVTASDLAIWNEHINTADADHRAGRFAVLNKIDVLWDDLQGERHTSNAIERVRRTSAEQLGISPDAVIPLSAKQGLIARVKHDELLLQRSAVLKLERLISRQILAQKESLMFEALIKDLLAMLTTSQGILKQRLNVLYDKYEYLADETVSTDRLQELASQTHEHHDVYYKKLITLQSSRRLMQSQGEILQQLVSPQNFEELLTLTRKNLHDSWSTLGMNRVMSQFFHQMDQALDNICTEARLADKMVSAVYQRFTADIDAPPMQPRTFSIKRERKQLNDLKMRSIRFRRNPRMVMTEQTILIKQFFQTFVSEARAIHERVLGEAKRWPDEALLPLMQYTLEQKKALEKQVDELKRLASTSRSAREQQTALKSLIDQIHAQLSRAETIQEQLKRPPPSQVHLQRVSHSEY